MSQPMTIEEVASLFRVHHELIRTLIRTKQLRAYRVGREWRIDIEDINEYKNKQKEN